MNVLVIAAHPDDEVLGCGATIAKHIKQGDNVSVAILSAGVTSRIGFADGEQQLALEQLAEATQKANSCLGVNSSNLFFEKFPDNQLDTVSRLEVTQAVEALVEKLKPERIYTHHAGDVNIDHRRIHEAVITACRPQPGHPVKSLLFFEVPSSTEWQPPGSATYFTPNWYNDVTETLAISVKALEAYEKEMREWPHPRSIKAVKHLARWRGATVGVDAAEAFMLGRQLL